MATISNAPPAASVKSRGTWATPVARGRAGVGHGQGHGRRRTRTRDMVMVRGSRAEGISLGTSYSKTGEAMGGGELFINKERPPSMVSLSKYNIKGGLERVTKKEQGRSY